MALYFIRILQAYGESDLQDSFGRDANVLASLVRLYTILIYSVENTNIYRRSCRLFHNLVLIPPHRFITFPNSKQNLASGPSVGRRSKVYGQAKSCAISLCPLQT
jgi:hypothetical protein